MTHACFVVLLDTVTIPLSHLAGSCQLVEDWFPAVEATRSMQRSSRRSDPIALPSTPFPASTFTRSATLQPTSSSGASCSSSSTGTGSSTSQQRSGSGLLSGFSFSWGKQRERQTSSVSTELAPASSSTLPTTSTTASSASSTSTLTAATALSGASAPDAVTVRVMGLFRVLEILPTTHYKPLIEVCIFSCCKLFCCKSLLGILDWNLEASCMSYWIQLESKLSYQQAYILINDIRGARYM